MRAVQVEHYGKEPELREVPEVSVVKPSDIVVKVGASGVCRTDLHIYHGELQELFPVEPPFTIGHETAGWVAEVGAAVEHLKVGDPVLLHPYISCGYCAACRAGNDMFCPNSRFPGLDSDGGMAENVRTSARAVVPLPSGLHPKDVAPLADAGITVYHAIKRAGLNLGPQQAIVVVGCGGLGHLAVQLLKLLSLAQVIVIDPTEHARSLAAELGADHVLWDDFEVEIAAITAGAGAAAVFDFVGEGEIVARAASLLGQGGTYVCVGYGGVLSVPTMDVALRELNVVGGLVGSYTDLVELVNIYAAGRLKMITREYPFADAIAALTDLEAGHVIGRGVLVMD